MVVVTVTMLLHIVSSVSGDPWYSLNAILVCSRLFVVTIWGGRFLQFAIPL